VPGTTFSALNSQPHPEPPPPQQAQPPQDRHVTRRFCYLLNLLYRLPWDLSFFFPFSDPLPPVSERVPYSRSCSSSIPFLPFFSSPQLLLPSLVLGFVCPWLGEKSFLLGGWALWWPLFPPPFFPSSSFIIFPSGPPLLLTLCRRRMNVRGCFEPRTFLKSNSVSPDRLSDLLFPPLGPFFPLPCPLIEPSLFHLRQENCRRLSARTLKSLAFLSECKPLVFEIEKVTQLSPHLFAVLPGRR